MQFVPMKRSVLTFVAVALLPASSLWAADYTAQLQQLFSALEHNFDKSKSPPFQTVGPLRAPTPLTQLREAIISHNSAQIESSLLLLSDFTNSASLRDQCQALAAQIHQDNLQAAQKLADDSTALLSEARHTVASAKTAADLDDIIRRLTQYRDAAAGGEFSSQYPVSQIDPTLQFIMGWQSYLSAAAVGDIQSASEALQQLANANQAAIYLIPRSEILARYEALGRPPQTEDGNDNGYYPSSKLPSDESSAPPAIDKPLTIDPADHAIGFNLKGLDDLDSAVTALEGLRSKPDFSAYADSINSSLNLLLPLDSAYRRLQAGLAFDITLLSGKLDSDAARNRLIPIEADLIRLALPRYLPTTMLPKAAENIDDYLARVAAQASAQGDFLLAARAEDTRALLLTGKEPDSDRAMQARLFVTGCNMDDAGQFATAVSYFERALTCPANLVPISDIRDRLAAVKAAHPDEFKRGLDGASSPVGFPFFRPQYPGNMFPTFPPGYPHRDPVLPIPAVSPSPAATKSKP